jgi:hypothetical protein
VRCPKHTLIWGIVKDLHKAIKRGQFWGDIVYEWEQEQLETETAEDKAQRELLKTMEEMKRMEGLRKLREEKYVNRNTGGLMKLNRPMPCKYVNEPETIDQWGVKWEAGCQHHKKGICPYLHPGQPGYEQALAMKSQRRRW